MPSAAPSQLSARRRGRERGQPKLNSCCCAPIAIGISPRAWSRRARSRSSRDARGSRGNHAGRHLVRLGLEYMDTGPYNKGKISRYYIARSKETQVMLPINPELGIPEHHEARWVDYRRRTRHGVAAPQARGSWAYAIINHGRVAGGRRLPSKSRDAPGRARAHRRRPGSRARGLPRDNRVGRPAHELALRNLQLQRQRGCIARHQPPKLAVAEPVAGSSSIAPPLGKKKRASAACRGPLSAKHVGHADAVLAADLPHAPPASARRGARHRSR